MAECSELLQSNRVDVDAFANLSDTLNRTANFVHTHKALESNGELGSMVNSVGVTSPIHLIFRATGDGRDCFDENLGFECLGRATRLVPLPVNPARSWRLMIQVSGERTKAFHEKVFHSDSASLAGPIYRGS